MRGILLKINPKFKYIFLIISLFCIIILFTFFQQFFFGFNTAYQGDIIYHTYRGEYFLSKGITWDGFEYPPGIPILISTMYITGLPNLYNFHILRIILCVLFIISFYLVAKKIYNNSYALCVLVFVSFPVTVWTSRIGDSSENISYSSIALLYPNFSGSSIDYYIVIQIIFLIYCILYEKQTYAYALFFFIFLFSLGIIHISRWILIILSVLTVFVFIYIKNLIQGTYNHKIFYILFITVLSFLLVTSSIYGWRWNNLSTSDLQILSNINYSFFIGILFSIELILILIHLTMKYSVQIDEKSHNISRVLFISYFISILVIMVLVNSNLSKYLNITGPFSIQDLFNFGTSIQYKVIFSNYFSIFLIVIQILGFFLLSKYETKTKSIVLIYLSACFIFILSLIFNFHPYRMNLDDYIRPFLFGIILYSLLILDNRFPQFIKKVLKDVKYIKRFLITSLIAVNIIAIMIIYVNIQPEIPAYNSGPLIDMGFSSSAEKRISTTYEFIETVNYYVPSDEIVCDSQLFLLSTYLNTKNHDMLPQYNLVNQQYISSFFIKHNSSRYLVVFHIDIVNNDFYNNINQYIIYKNDLNERIICY